MSDDRMERLRGAFERVLDAGPGEREAMLGTIRRRDGDAFADELEELLEVWERAEGELALDAEVAARLVQESPLGPPDGRDHLGRFELRSRLGSGGMGTTWLGYDPELDREVALKVLMAGTFLPDGGRAELLREARAVSRLDHPGIATVYDVGVADDGRLFMAMAYVPGENLAQRLARGPLPAREALDIARKVALALAAAHDAEVVHRDVKPANIMLSPDGSVRVLDFGIAGRFDARDGDAAPVGSGTPAYMSPEQARGDTVDGRADLFSLGVVLHEMLTGERPGGVPADDAPGVGDGRAATFPGPLRAVVARCLAEDPDERYPDARALVKALDRVGGRSTRRRVAVVLTFLAVLAVAVALLRPQPVVEGPVLAVLPFIPVGRGPELPEIARSLAVTMAMSMDGVGDVRTLDPLVLLGRRELRDPGATLEDRMRVARELGATAVVTGTVVDGGDHLRAEVRLTDTPGRPARLTHAVDMDTGDVVALSDSLSWAVLRGLWGEGEAPSPSIAGVTTSSFPALAAFLRGERAVVESRMVDAAEDFGRAVALDSTFTLAHWRWWWSLNWWSQPVPRSTVDHVLAHLDRLPARDSAFALATAEPDPYRRARLLRELAEAHPTDWLAWYGYQDHLVHAGGYLGLELSETRAAQERLVSLRPDLVGAWNHLFWVAREQRDQVAMERTLDVLETLSYDSLSMMAGGFDELFYYDVQARTLANDGLLGDQDLAAALQVVGAYEGPADRLRLVSNLLSEGLGRAQIQVSDSLLSRDESGMNQAAAYFGRSLALARRGRWREALDDAARYDALASTLAGARHGLRLSAVAAALGLLDPGAVASWEGRLTQVGEEVEAPVQAEMAWLLGLRDWAAEDLPALEGRRARLRDLRTAVPDSGAVWLEATLGALALQTSGDSVAAGRELARLVEERNRTGRLGGVPEVPFYDGVVRILASRWLTDADPALARSLLTWYETIRPDVGAEWIFIRADRVLEPVAHAYRARLAATAGRPERAGWHEARVAETWADPDAPVAALVRELGLSRPSLDGTSVR